MINFHSLIVKKKIPPNFRLCRFTFTFGITFNLKLEKFSSVIIHCDFVLQDNIANLHL